MERTFAAIVRDSRPGRKRGRTRRRGSKPACRAAGGTDGQRRPVTGWAAAGVRVGFDRLRKCPAFGDLPRLRCDHGGERDRRRGRGRPLTRCCPGRGGRGRRRAGRGPDGGDPGRERRAYRECQLDEVRRRVRQRLPELPVGADPGIGARQPACLELLAAHPFGAEEPGETRRHCRRITPAPEQRFRGPSHRLLELLCAGERGRATGSGPFRHRHERGAGGKGGPRAGAVGRLRDQRFERWRRRQRRRGLPSNLAEDDPVAVVAAFALAGHNGQVRRGAGDGAAGDGVCRIDAASAQLGGGHVVGGEVRVEVDDDPVDGGVDHTARRPAAGRGDFRHLAQLRQHVGGEHCRLGTAQVP